MCATPHSQKKNSWKFEAVESSPQSKKKLLEIRSCGVESTVKKKNSWKLEAVESSPQSKKKLLENSKPWGPQAALRVQRCKVRTLTSS